MLRKCCKHCPPFCTLATGHPQPCPQLCITVEIIPAPKQPTRRRASNRPIASARRRKQREIVRELIIENSHCPVCDEPRLRQHDCRATLTDNEIEYRKAHPEWRDTATVLGFLLKRYRDCHAECVKDKSGWCVDWTECPPMPSDPIPENLMELRRNRLTRVP